MLATWKPDSHLEIVAGTPRGGGLDRTARALARVIEAHALSSVPVNVTNVPGDGSRKAWAYLDERRGDPHVVSVSHPNLTTDKLLGIASFDLETYTPIATLYTEYIAFVTRAASDLRSAADLLERLRSDPGSVRVALSTARGNPNHIAVAKLARHAGADSSALPIRVFDSALDAVADAIAGEADVAAVTAASVIPSVESAEARVLAVSALQRMEAPFDAMPTWTEQGVDCTIGAWRGIAGAQGMEPAHVAYWERLLEAATQTLAWRTSLATNGWAPCYGAGPELRRALAQERTDFAASLRELGLLRSA
jgi:putative tricarboxylic transport membrane protein